MINVIGLSQKRKEEPMVVEFPSRVEKHAINSDPLSYRLIRETILRLILVISFKSFKIKVRGSDGLYVELLTSSALLFAFDGGI